jgi:diguanylate cyclase (GGDEF)-like protein/PAS domain S-box-containing protein
MARRGLFRPDTTAILAKLGVFEVDYLEHTGFSSDFWKSLGFEKPETAHEHWLDYVHPEDKPGIEAAVRRVWRGESDFFEEEFRLQTPDGETRWVLSRGYVAERDAEGVATRYVGLDVDIHTQKALENFYQMAMEEAQRKARESEALRKAGAIIAGSLEIHHTVDMILEQARNVIPYSGAAVLQRNTMHLEVIGTRGIPPTRMKEGDRIDVASLGPAAEQLENREMLSIEDIQESDYPFLKELRLRRGSFVAIPLVARTHTAGILVFFDVKPRAFDRDASRLAASFADHVSVALQNAELFEELRLQAATDSLTGSATRRSFFDRGRTLCLRAAREEQPLSLLMLDFDHFKTINDSYGHQEGDRILQEASVVINDSVRGHDVVGRYGGEEFAVILKGEELEAAYLVAERIREHLRGIVVGDGERTRTPLTASIGIAEMREHGAEDIDELLRCADLALYAAKTAGRDAIVVYDAERHEGAPPARAQGE